MLWGFYDTCVTISGHCLAQLNAQKCWLSCHSRSNQSATNRTLQTQTPIQSFIYTEKVQKAKANIHESLWEFRRQNQTQDADSTQLRSVLAGWVKVRCSDTAGEAVRQSRGRTHRMAANRRPGPEKNCPPARTRAWNYKGMKECTGWWKL